MLGQRKYWEMWRLCLTIEKNKGQSLKKKKATCAKAQKRPDMFLDTHVKMCVCAEYRNTHKNTKRDKLYDSNLYNYNN